MGWKLCEWNFRKKAGRARTTLFLHFTRWNECTQFRCDHFNELQLMIDALFNELALSFLSLLGWRSQLSS